MCQTANSSYFSGFFLAAFNCVKLSTCYSDFLAVCELFVIMCENVCLQVLSTCCDSKDLPPPTSSTMEETVAEHAENSQTSN